MTTLLVGPTMTVCWCCRAHLTDGRVVLGRLDVATVATVPVCPDCQRHLKLDRIARDACGEVNAQVRDDLGLELVCRRARVDEEGRPHAMPHRDGLWFWSTGTPETSGGWANITERDVRESMR